MDFLSLTFCFTIIISINKPIKTQLVMTAQKSFARKSRQENMQVVKFLANVATVNNTRGGEGAADGMSTKAQATRKVCHRMTIQTYHASQS